MGAPGGSSTGDGDIKIVDGLDNSVDTIDDSGTRRLAVDVKVTPSANDFKVKVTTNDTTGNFLLDKVIAGSSKILLAESNDGGDEDLSIDVEETQINHDALLNFESNEHVDHSAVSMIAGSGLSGGGDITASRTFDVDISAESSVAPQSADEVLIADASDSFNNKKTTAQEIADLAKPYVDTIVDITGLINQTTTLEPYLELTTSVPDTGDYRLDWSYMWSLNDGGQDFLAELRVNGVVIWNQRQEPKDTGGTGVTLPTTGGGTANSGTNQRYLASMHEIINLTSGSNTISIYFAGSSSNIEPAIYRGRISLMEWG